MAGRIPPLTRGVGRLPRMPWNAGSSSRTGYSAATKKTSHATINGQGCKKGLNPRYDRKHSSTLRPRYPPIFSTSRTASPRSEGGFCPGVGLFGKSSVAILTDLEIFEAGRPKRREDGTPYPPDEPAGARWKLSPPTPSGLPRNSRFAYISTLTLDPWGQG